MIKVNKNLIALILSVFFLPSGITVAQEIINIRKVRVNINDTTIIAGTLADVKIDKTISNVIYYWYTSSGIHRNQGGYTGNLLHGEYLEFNKDNNLIVKGNFSFGLKSGIWYNWYSDGKLKEISTWSEGKLDGPFMLYDENQKITFNGKYKENNLNGACTHVENDSIFQVKYRNGEILKRKFIDVF